MLGAGALLTELEQAGHGDDQDQQAGHDDGQHAALALPNGIGTLQGKAALEELDADEVALRELTDSVLNKLSAMADEDYEQLELYPDFDE